MNRQPIVTLRGSRTHLVARWSLDVAVTRCGKRVQAADVRACLAGGAMGGDPCRLCHPEARGTP